MGCVGSCKNVSMVKKVEPVVEKWGRTLGGPSVSGNANDMRGCLSIENGIYTVITGISYIPLGTV